MAARHPLPYAYAKAHSLLVEADGDQATLWASEKVSLPALSEVMRLLVINRIEREPEESIAQRIAAAYAGGEGSAAAVVGEVGAAGTARLHVA